MAIIRVCKELIEETELFDVLVNSFDSFEKVKEEVGVTIFRVHHEEIPREDVVIMPEVIKFDGIKPFVIEWE
jgi:hypothetical protein